MRCSAVLGGFAVAMQLSFALAAERPKMSAGIREYFITQDTFNFGSDHMARVKYGLEKEGFDSFTLAVRFAVRSEKDSHVVVPIMRTKMQQFESIISRILVANDELVIKPLLMKDPRVGVGSRLIGYFPENPDLFFATYREQLNLYFGWARKFGISEIVLGVGMGELWSVPFARHWVDLAQYAKNRVGERTRLSVEITSDQDIEAFQGWKSQDPGSFLKFSEKLGRLRIAGSHLEFSSSMMAKMKEIFPELPITLSNVTLPSCADAQWSQDEVECKVNSEDLSEKDARQVALLMSWFEAFDRLPPELKANISEVEFRAANTEFEPPEQRKDPRVLYDNESTRGLFRKWIDSGKTLVSPVPSGVPSPAPSRSPASVSTSMLEPRESGYKKKACIFYDRGGPKDIIGSIHASMLQSLLGAFRSWDSSKQEVRYYQKNTLEQCDSVFYIASNFVQEPPEGFYSDMAEFSKRGAVVWMNYKFPKFAKAFNLDAAKNGMALLGFDVSKVEQPLAVPTARQPDPGYYRFFEYKGEVFEKPARWNYQIGTLASSPELNIAQIADPALVSPIAIARHSKTNANTPYGLRRNVTGHNHEHGGSVWYFNDLPLAFVDSGTPYFILCDSLWDILSESPPAGSRSALVRIEDVNPSQDLADLRWTIDYLADAGVPFSMAVIPYYSNMFDDPIEGLSNYVWKPIDQYPGFIGVLRYAINRGAQIVFHGVEHMAGDLVSGFDGVSAADYEFWMYPQNAPHPKDSSDYVLDKLERGESVFSRLRIKPRVWESPHYAASGLDYLLFGKLFQWVYHKPIYFDADVTQDPPLPKNLRMFESLSRSDKNTRRNLLRSVKMEGNFHNFGGQIIPYPVYKDTYGQAVIPETLGFIDYPFYEEDPKKRVRFPEDLLAEAKRLKVVRGAYASFFWHVDLLVQKLSYYETHPGSFEKGGKNTLIKMVEGLRDLGYRFKSIEDKSLFPER